MIPITVITGFLGSGKTTPINRLVRDPAMANSAVLVNEFGDIGLDHNLVEHVDKATVLVGAGCLCCSVRGELVARIKALLGRHATGPDPAFGHLLIETTGLADPTPVLHTLLAEDDLKRTCRVASVVTAVDALHGGEHLDRHDESRRQVAAADRIVLTKTDLASGQDLQRLRARLTALNTNVKTLIASVDATALLESGADCGVRQCPSPIQPVAHDSEITSVSLTTDAPLEAQRLVAWIEHIMVEHGERLLRFKGITQLKGSDVPVAVHGVQHVFHPLTRLTSWRGGRRPSDLVLIGERLPESAIRESFSEMVRHCGH